MKVSICIPTLCNTETRFEKLVECIESSLNQSYKHIEVIVLDNASIINIKNKIKNIILDKRLYVFRNEYTISMPSNFNKAISHSSGEIIKPICDDDLIHPDLLSGCLPYIKKHPFMRIRDIGFINKVDISWSNFYTPIVNTNLGWRKKYDIIDAIAPTCTIFTRTVWENIGPYNEDTNYVWDYIFAMEAQLAYGFVIFENIGCGFRIWDESSTYSNKDRLRNFKEMHTFYRRNKSFNVQVAKYFYLLRNISKNFKEFGLPETIRIASKYL